MMSLAEVENKAILQPFTLEGSGALLPQRNLGILWCILVHSEAYREVHGACILKTIRTYVGAFGLWDFSEQ